MRFRLLNIASSVSFWALSFSPQLFAAAADVLSSKGKIDSLRTDSVSAISLRGDGRYLFLSRNASSFSAFDLQDMGLESSAVSTEGTVVDLFMPSSSELIVTHQKGVQYFDVSKPFDPAQLTIKYGRPTSALSKTVKDSCWLGQRKTALLEESSGSDHSLRFVDGSNSSVTVAWSSIFPEVSSSWKPKGIWCTSDAVIVLALTGDWSTQDQVRLARVSASTQSATNVLITQSDRVIADAVMSPLLNQLFVLSNRTTPLSNREDSTVLAISATNLETQAEIAVGSDVKALAAFKSGSDSRLGAFVGTYYSSDNTSASNRFSMTELPLTSSSSFLGSWGEGLLTAGSLKPSSWVFSSSDHYIYGLTESSGVSVLGRGPKLVLTTRPSSNQITQDNPLSFAFTTDRAIQYQLRLKQDYSLDGTSSGLSREYGVVVRTGVLNTDQTSETFSLSVSDLSLYLERDLSLLIVAWDASLAQDVAPQTRVGIPFAFDQPPAEVLNLKVKSGDQSIHLYFDPPGGGDIEAYYVDYSFTESDLNGFDSSVSREFDSGVSGYKLTSPRLVAATNKQAHVVVSPIANYQPMFFKVYAVDKSGQLTESPQTFSAQGYDTLSIPQALGGPQSCAMSGDNFQPSISVWLMILLSGLILLTLRFSGKKIGPSTSRNRRGGD